MAVNLASYAGVGLPAAGSPAEVFLARITAYLREHGLADASLRRLAAIAQTSPRMLGYYFGSREGALGAALQALREQSVAELIMTAETRREAMERLWTHYTSPDRELQTRLFFHLAGQAVDDPSAPIGVIASVVSTWNDAIAGLGVREGVSTRVARVEAELLFAATRGLLLDLLLTGDRTSADQGFQLLMDRLLGDARKGVT